MTRSRHTSVHVQIRDLVVLYELKFERNSFQIILYVYSWIQLAKRARDTN